VKITKKYPTTPVYLDERHRNPVSELIYIEFEKISTELHNLRSKCLHIFDFCGGTPTPQKSQPRDRCIEYRV
jgi:hypothetical protein